MTDEPEAEEKIPVPMCLLGLFCVERVDEHVRSSFRTKLGLHVLGQALEGYGVTPPKVRIRHVRFPEPLFVIEIQLCARHTPSNGTVPHRA